MIGKVKVIVLPLSGRRCLQGENFSSIIREEGILHIVSPVSGFILAINQKLINQPNLIREDPLGEGFLLTLKPKNFQQDEKYLIFGEAARSWCYKEVQRYEATIISELAGQEGVGMTMQDGGMKLRDARQSITPERYIQLVSTFLREGEKEFYRSKHKKDCNSTFQLR
jgi:glycine cleavage system H lipoate-binding protein